MCHPREALLILKTVITNVIPQPNIYSKSLHGYIPQEQHGQNTAPRIAEDGTEFLDSLSRMFKKSLIN